MVSASTRWPPIGALALAIAAAWTSFFAYQFWQSAGAVYRSLAGVQPAGHSQSPSYMIAFGEAFAACVMVPFVAVGCILLVVGAVLLAGRVEVRIWKRHGEIFTGIGAIGRRQHFDRSEVFGVRIIERVGDDGQKLRGPIELRTKGKSVCLGSILKDDRFYWLAGVLATELASEPATSAGTTA